MFYDLARSPAEASPQLRVTGQKFQRIREAHRIARGHEHPRLSVATDLAAAGDVRCDQRASAGRRFKERFREPFSIRREDGNVRAGVLACYVIGVSCQLNYALLLPRAQDSAGDPRRVRVGAAQDTYPDRRTAFREDASRFHEFQDALRPKHPGRADGNDRRGWGLARERISVKVDARARNNGDVILRDSEFPEHLVIVGVLHNDMHCSLAEAAAQPGFEKAPGEPGAWALVHKQETHSGDGVENGRNPREARRDTPVENRLGRYVMD